MVADPRELGIVGLESARIDAKRGIRRFRAEMLGPKERALQVLTFAIALADLTSLRDYLDIADKEIVIAQGKLHTESGPSWAREDVTLAITGQGLVERSDVQERSPWFWKVKYSKGSIDKIREGIIKGPRLLLHLAQEGSGKQEILDKTKTVLSK